MDAKDSTSTVGNRPSARWLRSRGEERATGQGAALIKRKLYNCTSEADEDEQTTYSPPTKRRPGLKQKDEPLDLSCGWLNCEYTSDQYEDFLKHVGEHLIKLEEDGSYQCKWVNCSHTNDFFDLFQCHVNYHPYIEKLKSIGQNLIQRLQLNYCKQAEQPIPTIETMYRCAWGGCTLRFSSIQTFFFHVKSHVNASWPRNTKKPVVNCEWEGCKIKIQRLTLLDQHVRTHTHEKVVACPHCSHTFASNTKFHDHCKRHDDDGAKIFQCNQCQKQLATKRLLRDHVRLHVNNYKCNFCDMTCISPATLARHVRYRHLPERPFQCSLCSHRAVTKRDIQSHMLTHYTDCVFECDDCDFKCRSASGLENHLIKIHNYKNEAKVYICHCCSSTFTRGDILTKHLLKQHNFQWPSGHSRFRYKQSPTDGYYRLHTIRFETIEVTEEIIRGPQKTTNVDGKCDNTNQTEANFLAQSNPNNGLAILNSNTNVVASNNYVLIDILQVDDKGNTVRSEMVESNEYILGL